MTVHDVKPFKQQLRWTCGPASLRTVLYYQFGLDLTDRELSLVLGTNKNGTPDFADGLHALGFAFKESSRGTFTALQRAVDDHKLPIVHIVVNDGQGHYVVVTGYDNENVYVADPALGRIVKYGQAYFMGIWKFEERETQTRWLLVVTNREHNRLATLIRKLENVRRKLHVE